MPRTKIQDHAEVKRWFEDGKTYRWMVEEYRRRYSIDTTTSLFGNLRRRHGWQRRTQRNADLIPWPIAPQHRDDYTLALLRMAARRRAGKDLRAGDDARLDNWLADLEREDLVVHYDPAEGFQRLPRREGVDDDLIREPEASTRWRAAVP